MSVIEQPAVSPPIAPAAPVEEETERSRNVAKIRLLAAELQGNLGALAGLERMMSALLGAKVRHVRSESVMPPRTNLQAYIRTRRTHTKHWLQVTGPVDARWQRLVRDGKITVFLKSGPKLVLSELETIVNEAGLKDSRPPYYFGSFRDGDLCIGVWEFVEGARVPFEDLSLRTQKKLVRAIAEMNLIKVGDAVQPKTKWVSAPLSWYERRFQKLSASEQATWQSALDGVRIILSHDNILADVIGGHGERLLTHNDINPNNAFTPEDGDIVFFDWEGATLSVPGADLRFLNRMQARDDLLTVYVERLAELGLKLDESDVKRAYEMVEGFRLIFKGWAAKNVNAVHRGIKIVSAHINNAVSRRTGAVLPAASEVKKPAVVQPAANKVKRPAVVQPAASEGNRMAAVRPATSEGKMSTAVMESPVVQEAKPKAKAPSAELTKKINEYVQDKGALYAPITHPAFSSLPCRWTTERFDLIKPHLDFKGGTALDIGTHWGYMAHRLEEMGYKVTANEHSPKHIYFLTELRDISGRDFKIVPGSVFDMKESDFDVVLALNIFHHFLKTDERFEAFQKFLARLNCRMMIYQSHRTKERPKLDTAGHYMESDEMAKFLADRLRLKKVEKIGVDGGRDVFKIS
jgi:2-polyprenyl-3-methyl-5-hydroxy-6-metoxy-1,4-benzoquinol methylase